MQNNPYTEAAAIVLAGLLIVGGALLTYASKIDFTQATFMYTLAAGIYGGNLALKAPSPSQQANMQQIVSDLTTAMGVLFQHTHAPAAPSSVPTPAFTPFTAAAATNQPMLTNTTVSIPQQPAESPFLVSSPPQVPFAPLRTFTAPVESIPKQ